MADSIVRLRVESQEYDAKLKRAADGLTRYADECRKVGGTLEVVEKDTLDYVRALGQMDATSRTATGKLAEMKKTFTELSVQYKNLTDAEKASPFGRALESSLSQLKGRISESKQQLDDITKDINGSSGLSGALDNLASKFGVNIKTLASWGTALAAGKAALYVAKDAFFASESNVDEWGRTVQAAQGLYVGFLNAINNGDISGYLDRMSQIVQAARQAYNELDTLGTMKTIQSPQKSRQQTENERIRSMIQTGRYIAPMDGRRNTVFRGKEMQNGQLLTPGQIRALERQLQNGMKTTVTLVEREVKQTGRAIDAYYNSIAKQNGMSLKEFRKGVSSWDEFSKKMQGYENYKRWDSEARTKFARQGGRGSVDFDKSNPHAEFRKWGNFRVDKMGENSYNDLTQLIQQRDQLMAQAYSMQSQAYRTMNRAEGLTLRKIMNGGTTGGGGGKGGGDIKEEKDEFEEIIGLIPNAEEAVRSLQQQIRLSEDVDELKFLNEELRQAQENLKELQNIGDTVSPAVSDTRGLIERRRDNYVAGLAAQGEQYNDNILNSVLDIQQRYGLSDINMSSIQDAMENGGKVSDDELRDILRQLNEKLSGTGMSVSADGNGNISDERTIDKLRKDIDKGNELYSKAVGGISNIVGGMQQLGVEIPEGLSQLLNALGGISTILTGISSILSFISVVTSAKPFALGGVVKAAGGVVAGRNFSGDAVPALLSSGEVVLNRAEVSTLAATLENGNRNESVDRQPYVTGEYIFLGLNNYLRGSGRGSIVTSKR